jgi:hypothetical protein
MGGEGMAPFGPASRTARSVLQLGTEPFERRIVRQKRRTDLDLTAGKVNIEKEIFLNALRFKPRNIG